jgi:outer membrane protein assembly factor BamB
MSTLGFYYNDGQVDDHNEGFKRSNLDIEYEFEFNEPSLAVPRTRATTDAKYWATFQFDYSNTGNSSSKAPNTNNTIWKFNDDGDLKGQIFSTPIVVNDYVYFTTDFGNLYAVDRHTGDKKWKFDLQKRSYGTPTFSNGYIYVGTGTEQETNENYLYRINAETGQEDQDFRIQVLEGAITGAPVVLDSPGVTEDRLYFGTLKDNSVYSYNMATAQPQPEWTYKVANAGMTSNDGIWSSVTYYAGIPKLVLFTVNSVGSGPGIDHGLYCLNAEDHAELWHFPTEDPGVRFQTYSSPTLFFDKKANQGKAIFGAGIEYSDSTHKGILYCLDITTGAQLWNFSTTDGAFGYGVVSSAVVAYDMIIFGSTNGKLYALDLNGSLLWDFQTKDKSDGIYSSPAVADNKVFFGSTDKNFYCLNVHDGSLIWSYNTSIDSKAGTYGVASSPAIAYNRVYVGGCNGYLYCFGSMGSEPPTINIESPNDNDLVNGTVQISGTAADDIAVTYVQVKIDNGTWENTTGTTDWSYFWDTNEVTDGVHAINARAFDDSGFTKTNISVIVHNSGGVMFVQLTSHKDGQIVAGTTKFEGIAYHTFGIIQEIQINIDNSSDWEIINGTTEWYHDWDTTTYEDGEYLIQFRAIDNVSNSTPISVVVNVLNYVEDPSIGIYPMFRANQNRIGITGYKVPNKASNLWKFETQNAIESSVTFYNNRIYFGSDDWFIYCVNANTGLEQWSFETSNQVRSTPAIAERRLYVGSQDYHLYCLNALSGELIWKYKTDGEVDSSPLIVGDRVYFGSYDGFLYALNATDKSEIWKFNTGSEIWGSPAFTEDSIYIGTKNGKMYSVWANNGTEHWNYSTNQFEELHGIYSTPVVTGDRVIFGSEDKFLYSLNASTGDRVWMFKTTGYIYSSAAVGSGKVYFTSLEEQKDGILYALPFTDPNSDGIITSSEVLWKFNTKDFDGGSSPTFSITTNKVVIGSNHGSSGGDGKVFCLDANTGAEFWNFTTGGDVHGSPIVAVNRIYIGSLDNFMYCLGEKPDDQDSSQIKIKINLPVNRVLAGHAIENITFTALNQDDEPIPQAWFNFMTTKGYLSAYFGTAFEDGSYTISFIAPEPAKVQENISVILSSNATRFPYKIGNNSVEIIVEPRQQKQDNDTKIDDNGDGDFFDNLLDPDNNSILIIIVILLFLNVVIFSLFYVSRRKLKRLEQPKAEDPRAQQDEEIKKESPPVKSTQHSQPQKPKATSATQLSSQSQIAKKSEPADPTPPASISSITSTSSSTTQTPPKQESNKK